MVTKEITLWTKRRFLSWYGGGAKKILIKVSEMQKATAVNFSQLLEMVAKAVPALRIRFSTSNLTK